MDAQAYRNKTGNSFKQLPPSKIIAWIERNFDYKTRKGGLEYCINCPFDSDNEYKFNINPEKGVCNYWRGNEWAGPINPETGKRNCSFVKFVRLYRNCSYKDALKEVLGASEDISSFMKPTNRLTDEETKKTVSVALPETARLLFGSSDRQALALKKWLGKRGYSEEDVGNAELHYVGLEVYWPYYEFDTLVYYQSRSRVNKRFNFPSAEQYDKDGNLVGKAEFSKGDFLYGFDDVNPASYLIITEAIFDKHTLGEQSLASGGAILTDNQIKKLKILGPRDGIILSPDNDKAGVKSILSNCELLKRQGYKVYYSLPPNGIKDWNELVTDYGYTKREVRELHDNNIMKLTTKNMIRLRKMLGDFGKVRI